jgi:23S rRNA pseudouridine1911/1915/1917 synthase
MRREEATVPDTLHGARLDRALAAIFRGHSRSALSRLIAGGRVRVAGKAATKPSLKVEAGTPVEVEFPPPEPSTVESQDLPLSILYEDAEIAVIDKPAGVVVHPAAGHRGETLVNALLYHVRDLSGVGGELRPGIVHRLDKETSGVMIVAKNDAAHRRLTAAWGTERVRKEYLAVVYGTPSKSSGLIDAPIARDPRNRKRMAVVRGGRRAVTEYEVLERLRHVSVLRCLLRTGRTHQIRVHLKHLGHPLVGDPLYSGPQWRGIPEKKLQKALASMKRQALHAWRITIDGRTFEAPLPEDMRTLIVECGGKPPHSKTR